MLTTASNYVITSEEVAYALANHLPVLALESTLITHGLPTPHNLAIAVAAETITREAGVVPATIAIIKGQIKIGLEEQDLAVLIEDKQVIKASTRDIPYAITQKINAGTTVAATLFCARLAGIKVFATGGIGGVHRGDAWDISADLIELSRSPVALICAGAKAILDIAKTLELLESLGVPVIGYQTKKFPAFYTRESKFELSCVVNTVDQLRELMQVHWDIGLASGMLIANPIPAEFEISDDVITPAIQKALNDAEKRGIAGKAITPYLLSQLATLTAGLSLQANKSLILHNVALGAQLARKLMGETMQIKEEQKIKDKQRYAIFNSEAT